MLQHGRNSPDHGSDWSLIEIKDPAIGAGDATEARTPRARSSIGPAGRLARAAVGLAFIGLALFWRDPDWLDVVLGLVIAPVLVLGAMSWRARRSTKPLRAIGPVGHAVNLAVVIPLFALPVTAGAAFLFYGASMLLAAARRNGGCEVTAFSNAVLRRDDQVGCALFAPVDLAEEELATRRRRPSAVAE